MLLGTGDAFALSLFDVFSVSETCLSRGEGKFVNAIPKDWLFTLGQKGIVRAETS